jgi:hypothetical protein
MIKIEGIKERQKAQTEKKTREGPRSEAQANGQKPEAQTQRMPYKTKGSNDSGFLSGLRITLNPKEQGQSHKGDRTTDPQRAHIRCRADKRDQQYQIFNTEKRKRRS